MIKNIKRTYTLKPETIELIKKISNRDGVSKSKFVAKSIQLLYPAMLAWCEDYKPSNQYLKKKNGTIPFTITLPVADIKMIGYFAKRLNIKLSHLISLAVEARIED